MSLINSVLRDLANRQARNESNRPWQKEIRALPIASKPEKKTPNLVITGLFIACISGALGYQFAHWGKQAPEPITLTLPAVSLSDVHAGPAGIPQPGSNKLRETLPPAESLTQLIPERSGGTLQHQPAGNLGPEAPQSRSLPSRTKAVIQKIETPATSTPRLLAEQALVKANTSAAQGQTDAAIAACYEALDHDPAYVAARQRLLGLLERNGRQDEAAVVVADGLNQSPAQIGWAMWLSHHELKKGNIVDARQILKRSENFAKKNADYSGFQGHLAFRQSDNSSAIQHYRNAAALNPRDGRWWFGLGEAINQTGDKAGAAEAFRNALSTGNLPATLADIASQRLNQ